MWRPLCWVSLLLLGSVSAFVHPTRQSVRPHAPVENPQRRRGSCYLLFVAQSTSRAIQQVDIREKAPRDIAAMDEWATACGVQRANGVQLTPTSQPGESLDVGVMTTTDLPANSPVALVPRNMILSSLSALQEFGRLERAEQLLMKIQEGDHIPQFYLLVKLLHEYQRGTQSPWYPWLNSLPRYYSNGSSMTHFCCKHCLPPFVGTLANAERIRFSKFFQALRRVDGLDIESSRSRQIAKWAFAVVSTRSLDVNGDPCLVPMADMFNHGTDTEITWNYDQEGNWCAYTTCDVPAGSPLRMSYGDPTNPSYLFARYGFLDESSPATFCKIIVDNPPLQLVDMGYDHSKLVFYKDTGEVSQQVWDVLLYLLLGEAGNMQVQQALYQAHVSGDVATKQSIHQQYYPQTAAALRNHVDHMLYQLDVLSEKARTRMNAKKSSKHPRLPLILKHNEFVKRTFLKVRAQLG